MVQVCIHSHIFPIVCVVDRKIFFFTHGGMSLCNYDIATYIILHGIFKLQQFATSEEHFRSHKEKRTQELDKIH